MPDQGNGKRPLQGRALEFKVVEPWPDPIKSADLLEAIHATLRAHVAMSPHAVDAVTLWILASWNLNEFEIFARLAFLSPEKGCGKTTAMKITGELTRRRMLVSSISPAALFRTVEKFQPTLLIDEVDAIFARNGNEEMRQLLNSSHERENAQVIRTVGEQYEPRAFSTWTPIVLAAIGRLPETLTDRSIVIPMARKTDFDGVTRLRMREIRGFCLRISRWAAKWSMDHRNELAEANPDIPDGVSNRARDNWEPLLAVADLAGGDWPERARVAALRLSGEAAIQNSSNRVILLADIRDLFELVRADRLSSQDICDSLAKLESRPWAEWGQRGKPISPPQLARLLRPFGITPGTIRQQDKTPKGYERDQFADAWARYIPPQTATLTQPPVDSDLGEKRSATPADYVAVGNTHEGLSDKVCGAVAVPVGGDGQKPCYTYGGAAGDEAAGETLPGGDDDDYCVNCGALRQLGGGPCPACYPALEGNA